ncbi:MAG: transketolase, partial [Fimbriimonadaceae bacterium]|nr:transketolase [Alphaproteobacteria bacterium]
MLEASSKKGSDSGSGTAGNDVASNSGTDKLRTMANAVRALSIDAVEAANSGHPGLPLGAADVATVLFAKYLNFDPTCPHWPDRDRFVLSAGHGSMLLYALLHLTGYEDMSLEEIKNFRQLGSKAAGHPEFGFAGGIETTTGPLGQGLANAVGMAIAERSLNARFGDDLIDHYTYVLAGDGDLMEGISHEAISHAGQLKLSRLIVLFDDNEISIDGPVSLSDIGNQQARFEAAGWHAQSVDGHDMDAIAGAIESAKASDKPSMIACRTKIGFGAPNKEGTSGAHGAPLGAEELAATKQALGWTGGAFEVPTDVRDAWRLAGLRGVRQRKAWDQRLIDIGNGEKSEFERRMRGDLPAEFTSTLNEVKKAASKAGEKLATRVASGKVLEAINAVVPETLGGSADLTGSVNTRTSGMTVMGPDNYGGRFIHYGVREHGMAAAMNGMALHGGVIPYSGTFLVFSDYCRPAIRLSALMHQRVVYVMTHDSIGLGEDGPTHQPVEHLAALRAIPGVHVFRPADIV